MVEFRRFELGSTNEYDSPRGRCCDADEVVAIIAKLEAELAYLRWFHKNVDFGPAHGDVIYLLQQMCPVEIPEGWKLE
jgi:hypothetical protein